MTSKEKVMKTKIETRFIDEVSGRRFLVMNDDEEMGKRILVQEHRQRRSVMRWETVEEVLISPGAIQFIKKTL